MEIGIAVTAPADHGLFDADATAFCQNEMNVWLWPEALYPNGRSGGTGNVDGASLASE
ncbi:MULTISPECIES: hypothetical protein [unclassified Variovorax]|jgi:hypothetical protein|uniref:hypothetical protein n=1 Tax=unclassified Variovorax TaxID=663243 RepID=UPI0008D578EB|nr:MULTISPECIES: hypothetical protein [unclassified Variovorax]SEK14971.1 hypothetical protein SAMN05518853_11644 [Variovorax sp. OK202]SFE07081.1 hypothetical protein SAMN05444746_11644 [Variovorax sp. OK212]